MITPPTKKSIAKVRIEHLNRLITENSNDQIAVDNVIQLAKASQVRLRNERTAIALELERLDKFIASLHIAKGEPPPTTEDLDEDLDY